MNNKDKPTRAEKLALRLASSKIGDALFSTIRKARLSVFVFVLFTHSLFWFTSWWSPWPYLIFSIVGIWFSQGIFKPWSTIMSQATKPEWDSVILIITIPFIILNYIAVFACLYMFGSVIDANNEPINGMWKHFYFSTITLTTLGYGNIVPNDLWAEIVATIQSIIGFMGFAVFAGVIASIAVKRVEISNKT